MKFILILFSCFVYCECNQASKLQEINDHLQDVYPELFSRQYQGDIFLLNGDEAMKNAVRDVVYRWPNATIPYRIGSNFTEEEKTKIYAAMKRLQNETCIQFVLHDYQKHYVHIDNNKKGCFAVIGYHTKAEEPHPINFETPACLKHQGTIEHEFLHVLGLFHEQSRSDRDDYVIVYWGNITAEFKSNFEKMTNNVANDYDIPYDITSVMHYPRLAFSKNGNETIISKNDSEAKLGQRIGATQGDLNKIRKMYKCNKRETAYGSPEWLFNQMNKFLNDNKLTPAAAVAREFHYDK